jgi:tRNA (adenine-N(1)-)-methyltransferase non-catalytic subunit
VKLCTAARAAFFRLCCACRPCCRHFFAAHKKFSLRFVGVGTHTRINARWEMTTEEEPPTINAREDEDHPVIIPDHLLLSASSPSKIMKENDVVLLHMNNTRWQFVNLKPKKTCAIGKHKNVKLDPLLKSVPFGSLFEVDQKGILERVGVEMLEEDEIKAQIPVEDERSNKAYDDLNGKAQKLSDKEIQRMQQSGVSGQAIVDELVANSATFNQKTAFAQEKYKMKKMKKHLTKIIARWPSPRYVCEAYFYKSPQITNSLRFDILGLMMNLGNVMANSQPLIVEDCGGVIVGAAATRMGGKGIACAGYVGEHPSSMETIKQMNLTDEERSVIMTTSLRELAKAKRKWEEEQENGLELKEEEEDGKAEKDADAKNKNNSNGNGNDSIPSKKKLTKATRADVDYFIRKEKFTSLILAHPQLDPKTTLPQLLEFCANSTPFIVWSMTLQPLADTMHVLRKRGLAVSMTISEPFLRDHQVLPGRTHPVMTTEANSGGYILSGTHAKQPERKSENNKLANEEQIGDKAKGAEVKNNDDSEMRESKKPRCE